MPRHLSFLVAPLVWLSSALPLGAQTALFNAIPDNALGLVVVNNMSDASAKVHKLTEKMKLPVPELLPIVKSFSGAQEGVDEQGSIAAVALASDDEDATWGMSFAAFVPVTDYKAFIKQLDPKDAEATITEVTIMGQQYLATKKGNYAVLCGDEQKDVLEAILASTKGVAGTLAPLAPWMAEQQVALVVTPAGKKLLFEKITKAFAETKDSNDEDDDKAKEKNADSEDESETDSRVRAGKQLLRSVKIVVGSIEPQLTHVGLGIRIDEQTALHVAVRVLFAPAGALGQWAQNVKPPKGGPLVGLPPDKFVIAYGGASIQLNPEFTKLIDLVSTTGLEMLGLDDDLRKQYAAIVARHRANQLSICGLLGPPRPGDSLASTSLAVEHVKDAKEHLKLTREQVQVMHKGAASDDSKLPTYAVSEVTIGDLKAIEVVMDLSAMTKELEAAGPAEGFMQGLMLRMFGGDGKMRIYFAVADDTHLVSGYSKALLQHGVEHVRSGKAGLESDPQIAKTNDLLPNGAQWVAYVNPQGLVQWIDTLLRQSLPAEMKFRLPAFPPSDPIGMAAKASASGLDAELVLPESVLAGIGQYVGLVQQMIQGGGAPLP